MKVRVKQPDHDPNPDIKVYTWPADGKPHTWPTGLYRQVDERHFMLVDRGDAIYFHANYQTPGVISKEGDWNTSKYFRLPEGTKLIITLLDHGER